MKLNNIYFTNIVWTKLPCIHTPCPPKPKTSSLWPQHHGFDNLQTAGRNYGENLEHHRMGGLHLINPAQYSKPPYVGPYKPPANSYSYQYESKPKPAIECDYIPRENCTKIAGSRNCKQIPREVPEQICIEGIPVQKVREECNDVTRQGMMIEESRVMLMFIYDLYIDLSYS